MSKAEIYAHLIKAGVVCGFHVVPEYRIKPSLESKKKREVDVAWWVPHPKSDDGRPWLPAALFEIEGHDVERSRDGEQQLRGVEKDADAILSATSFAFQQSRVDILPAAAVVLFRLDESGKEHKRRFEPAYFEETRELFASAVTRLRQKHVAALPSSTAEANWPVLLDEGLTDERVETFVRDARAFRDAVASKAG